MNWRAEKILSVYDQCAKAFTFPMLDNGYVYLAATRLSLFRSKDDWATVIEVFGFSPRSGIPDTNIFTFASKINNRNKPEDYVSEEAYRNYLENNPNNEVRFVYPIDNDDWIDEEDPERVGEGVCLIRGESYSIPGVDEYARHNIALESDSPYVYEFCRLLAAEKRDSVLATERERRISVASDLDQILRLDDWHHPNLVEGELPGNTETFQQLAKVLETGDVSIYEAKEKPNTHGSNWPDGGSL